jgi:hypothetical protein
MGVLLKINMSSERPVVAVRALPAALPPRPVVSALLKHPASPLSPLSQLTNLELGVSLTSLPAPMGLALRCDVAAALAPLGVALSQITLTAHASPSGAITLVSPVDPDISACSLHPPPSIPRHPLNPAPTFHAQTKQPRAAAPQC